jgi:ornithine cyclodeaminase
MALIGNGAQAEFQTLAFMSLVGIRRLRVFDTDRRATAKLLRNLQPYVDLGRLAIEPCASTAEAVQGSDIVTTATADKSHAAILAAGLIAPGMHLNALGGDCPGKTELDPRILQHAHVFVEYAPQSRLEGEIQHMPHDFEVTELWRVLANQAPGRTHADQVTVFDSVGFALEDFSALRTLERLAREHELGRMLSLVPAMADAKDLWGWAHGG